MEIAKKKIVYNGVGLPINERIEEVYAIDTPDYWERLKHQAAISAMQGILSNQDYCKLLIDENQIGSFADDVSRCAKDFATALVEKLKEEK